LRRQRPRAVEAIPLALDSKQILRVVGILAKRDADFPDRCINTVVGVPKRVAAPQDPDNVSARHQFAPARCHENQEFHRQAFQSNALPRTAQFVALHIELDVPDPDGFVRIHVPSSEIYLYVRLIKRQRLRLLVSRPISCAKNP
jgi:hypothetical protein